MTEALTFIVLLDLPADGTDAVVKRWNADTAMMAGTPGFQDVRLYCAASPGSRYGLVSISEWESLDPARSALTEAAS